MRTIISVSRRKLIAVSRRQIIAVSRRKIIVVSRRKIIAVSRRKLIAVSRRQIIAVSRRKIIAIYLIKEYGPYGPQGPWAHKTKMFLAGPGARGQGHDPKKAPGVRPGAGAFFGSWPWPLAPGPGKNIFVLWAQGPWGP